MFSVWQLKKEMSCLVILVSYYVLFAVGKFKQCNDSELVFSIVSSLSIVQDLHSGFLSVVVV
jgi:hypothetical protein